jgi:hypothetical protein
MTSAAGPTPRSVPRVDTGEHASGKGPHRANGPNPGVLAAVSLSLTLASLAASAVLAGGKVYVSPFAPTGQIVGYYQQHGTAVRVSAALLFGSAVPLGIFAATAYTRLLRLGVRVPGPSIGFFGGITASVMLMLSAAASWILGRPELAGDAAVMRALSFLAFCSGGIGYVIGLGLLVAGLAVPALVLHLVPRWLGWAGLAIAAVSEVTFLSMMLDPLQVLLPVGRFGGLAWLVAVGFLLPTHRHAGPVSGGQER